MQLYKVCAWSPTLPRRKKCRAASTRQTLSNMLYTWLSAMTRWNSNHDCNSNMKSPNSFGGKVYHWLVDGTMIYRHGPINDVSWYIIVKVNYLWCGGDSLPLVPQHDSCSMLHTVCNIRHVITIQIVLIHMSKIELIDSHCQPKSLSWWVLYVTFRYMITALYSTIQYSTSVTGYSHHETQTMIMW